MKLKIALNFLFLGCSILLFAQNEAFQQANEFYQQKKYEEAIKSYERILNDDLQSPELHFNLGNAYYKNNDLGKAILHYERALVLASNNEDVEYNLDIARAKRIDEIEVLPPFFLTAWWQGMRRAMSSTAWSSIALILLWGGIAGLALFFLGKERQQKKWGLFGGLAAILICLLPFSLAYSRANLEKSSGEAIILAEEVDLKSGPDNASTTLNELHEGTKVSLLDVLGDWHQVRLPNGEVGWLEYSGLEEI